jgi:photosystem II stability/assembly factor-like uncharacterized protein
MRKVLLLLCGVCLTTICQTQLFAQQYIWDPLPSPESKFRYNDIYFANPKLGWTIHPFSPHAIIDPKPFGEIYNTTNGGTTWTKQFGNVKNHFRCVGFTDSLHGWVFSLGVTTYDPPDTYDTTLIYATTDGGTTWNAKQNNITGPIPAGMCGVSVVDDSSLFACGRFTGPAHFMKTTDKGTSWYSKDMSEYLEMLIDCHFFSRDSGIVVGGSKKITDSSQAVLLFTSDGGNTWSERYRGERKGEWFWKISFPNDRVGYISIESMKAPTHGIKTTDKGLTWTDMPISSKHFTIQGIGFVNEKVGWVGGWDMKALETKDGGITWTESSIVNNINRFRFFGDTLGYVSGISIAIMQRFGVKTLRISRTSRIRTSQARIYVSHWHHENTLISGYTIHWELR